MNSNVNGKGAAAVQNFCQKKSIDVKKKALSFEPRHENKSCSACPEDQLELF